MLRCIVKSTISFLFIPIHLISLPHQPYKRSFKLILNSLFLHLLLLIIHGIIAHIGHTHTHTPLKRHILYLKHANIQRKFYQSKPLYTNTANFAPSSNLQEILSNISQTTLHLLTYSYL